MRLISGVRTGVLIVGAGPTGLTLANVLARQGVDFIIIDASPVPPIGSRGKGTQPRTLELFDDLGIVEQVIGNGRFALPVKHYDDAGQARVESAPSQTRPDTPYPTTLITPQWRIEEALRARLAAWGGQVAFGATLAGFTRDADRVTAHLVGPDGPITIEASWLVGCDGGGSAVRHMAGIAFLGETLETHRMLVGDVHATALDRDHWHVWRSREGFLALCPLPSTEAFQFQASIAPGQESEPSLAVCQRLVERRAARNDIQLSDPSWLSLWRANIRMVDRYRAGRVFLAGDAAHVHPPAGGQGMNTGIQDACNLGWKLAAVLGGASEALLETYQAERLPIAASVLGLSREIMAATVASGTLVFRRDGQTQQLGIGYRESGLTQEMRLGAEGLHAGDRAPDAPCLVGPDGACRIFDLLRGPQVTLLGFGAGWAPLIADCIDKFGPAVQGHVIVEHRHPQPYFVDSQGHARAAYGDGALYVVRPDNYVGMATDTADMGPICQYLAQIVPSRRQQ